MVHYPEIIVEADDEASAIDNANLELDYCIPDETECECEEIENEEEGD